MKLLPQFFIGMVALLIACKPATNPAALINHKASLPQNFKLSNLHQKVITTFINNRQHITGVLYGNAQACTAATAGKLMETPGESFTLVTWHQQDDEHWFGARIPGNLISAETLTLTQAADGRRYSYQKYLGKKLTKLADTADNAARIKFIVQQRASVTP